jgi:phage shock protein C
MVNFESDEEKEFYNSYITARKMSMSRLKRKYDSLENRIRRMESIITAREYDWDRRLESGA